MTTVFSIKKNNVEIMDIQLGYSLKSRIYNVKLELSIGGKASIFNHACYADQLDKPRTKEDKKIDRLTVLGMMVAKKTSSALLGDNSGNIEFDIQYSHFPPALISGNCHYYKLQCAVPQTIQNTDAGKLYASIAHCLAAMEIYDRGTPTHVAKTASIHRLKIA